MPNTLTTSLTVTPTQLSENISDASTIIIVADASDFASSGVAMISQSSREIVTYTGKTSRTLTGVTRGTNGTTARDWLTGATVSQVDWTPIIAEADTVATTADIAERGGSGVTHPHILARTLGS